MLNEGLVGVILDVRSTCDGKPKAKTWEAERFDHVLSGTNKREAIL
jgi:hypothetical protein